jgi:glyoxylase-like metal-dependent hydrolase (beta-lactamase superfamily II)
MQLLEHLYLVGSDQMGLSSPRDSNLYLIDGGSSLCLIDVGRASSTDRHAANIDACGFSPDDIEVALLTHADPGHSEASRSFQERFGASIWISEHGTDLIETGDSERFKALRRYGIYEDDYAFPTATVGRALAHDDVIQIGEVELRAIRVRGHSSDSLLYLGVIDGKRVLFTGDTLFLSGHIGLVNLPGCSIADYRDDIVQLAGLDVDLFLPAHGMFVMEGGQRHVDAAIGSFMKVTIPPNHAFAI